MKLLNYIERKSLIHSLNGASKLFCLLMWICSTMITCTSCSVSCCLTQC